MTASDRTGEASSPTLPEAQLGKDVVGGRYRYNDTAFIPFINDLYSSPEQMHANVEKLVRTFQAQAETDEVGARALLASIKWGAYQPILSDASKWPDNTSRYWQSDVEKARASLSKVPNGEQVGYQDPPEPPANRCDLLDALVQRCFNRPASSHTRPGIPMVIDVTTKPWTDAHRDLHDIVFRWILGPDGAPVKLYLTMICPYGT